MSDYDPLEPTVWGRWMADHRAGIRTIVVFFLIATIGTTIFAFVADGWTSALPPLVAAVGGLGWGYNLAVHNPRMVDRYDRRTDVP